MRIYLMLVALLVPACLDANEGKQRDGAPLSHDETTEADAASQPDSAGPEPDSTQVHHPDTGATPDTALTPDTATTEPDTAVTPDTKQCLALSAECMQDAECCSGICGYIGPYALTNPCIEALDLGAECARDNWCQSGACVNGHCSTGGCLAQGDECSYEPWRCCGATLCSWRPDSYARGFCTPLLEAGASCSDNLQCVSQYCDAGACR